MRIFLVANNQNLNNNWCNRMNKIFILNNDDIVIRFTKLALFNLFYGVTNEYYIRSGNNNIYNGLINYKLQNNYIINNKNNIKIKLIISNNNKNKNKNDIIKINNINNIKINNILYIDELRNLLKSSPSSGFIVLLDCIKKYPNSQIYLMGFNFYNGIINWHNFNKEYKFIINLINKTKRIKIII